MAMRADAVAHVVQTLVDEGVWCTGVQCSVAVPERDLVVDLAVGERVPGVPMRVDVLFNTWCATRPIVGLALLAELEQSGRGIDEPLGDFIDCDGDLADTPIHRLLAHNAGLSRPNALEANLSPLDSMVDLARQAVPDPHALATYSDFVASVLLADVLSELTGGPANDVLKRFLCVAGLDSEIRFDLVGLGPADRLDLVGCYIYGLPVKGVPLYHDLLPSISDVGREIFGGYCSARGLCTFYAKVLQVLGGQSVPGLPSPSALAGALARRRGAVHDAYLERICDFSAGFMVGLAAHGYGRSVSDDAIGHSGMMGSPFGFCDPQSGVAAAGIWNGLALESGDSDHVRRRLVDAIYEDVAELDVASGPAPSIPGPELVDAGAGRRARGWRRRG